MRKRVAWSVIVLGATSWWATGRFTGAVMGLLFLPVLLAVLVSKRRIRMKDRMAQDFVANLYALKGLLDVGTPFPQALYLISKESSTQLTFLFNRVIRGFQIGKSLEANFNNLEFKSPGEWILRSLKLLETAYRKGLGLSPLVESLIQVIELENQVDERLKRLQKDLGIQALIASLIPWFIGWVCWLFQPEMISESIGSAAGKLVVCFMLFWEGLGVWVFRQAVRFY